MEYAWKTHKQTSPRKYIMWENIILNTNPKLLKDCSLIISSFFHVLLNAIHKYTITMKEMKRKTLNFDQENKQQSNLFLFKIKYQKRRKKFVITGSSVVRENP